MAAPRGLGTLRARAYAGLRRAASRAMEEGRARPLRVLETALAVVFVRFLVSQADVRYVARVWLSGVFDAAISLAALMRVDGPGTASSVGIMVGRLALAGLPFALRFRSIPRHRRIWVVPVMGIVFVVTSPVSLGACETSSAWLRLALASAAAIALSRVPYFGFTVVLPFMLLWEPALDHDLRGGSLVREAAGRQRVLAECTSQEGERPVGLGPPMLRPYYGINAVTDDLVLISAVGRNDGWNSSAGGRDVASWWLRRRDGRFRFELPSGVSGNLWRGCLLDGVIWMARAQMIIGVQRLPDGGTAHEQIHRIHIPSLDFDLAETGCDPARHRLYITEATRGGMWETTPAGEGLRRHELGGKVLFLLLRSDGLFVVHDTAALAVFSPSEGRVVERVPAALFSFGFDLCKADGAVVMADLSGRLRVFERDGAGHYRFSWALPLFAPRRVAYSRDCSRIAVTSGNDHSVFVIDASRRRVMHVYRAGPALREVAATGPREFSITDGCGMATYRW